MLDAFDDLDAAQPERVLDRAQLGGVAIVVYDGAELREQMVDFEAGDAVDQMPARFLERVLEVLVGVE